jgi:hypothetical protein
MEGAHEDTGDPVDAAFLIGATHAQVLFQTLARLAEAGKSIRFARGVGEFEDGRIGVRNLLIALYFCGVDQCSSPSKLLLHRTYMPPS